MKIAIRILPIGVCLFAPLSFADLADANKPSPVNASNLTSITVHPNWQLVWKDEFSDPTLDTSKWSVEHSCWGGGNEEKQCYTPNKNNVFIQSGNLVLQALYGSSTGPALYPTHPDYLLSHTKTLPFSSGKVLSKGKGDWRYGRMEIRAKLPQGQGTWPAIWMLPTDHIYGTWAASGEIDIMEAVNLGTISDALFDPAVPQSLHTLETRVHGTLHYGATWPDNIYTGSGVILPNKINPADNFHTYAIEWEQGEIRWYVDNYHFLTQRSSHWYSRSKNANGEWITAESDAPFNERFYLILNLAIGGVWPENTNEKGINTSNYPKQLLIDYVRVYECSDTINTGKGCAAIDPKARILLTQ